MGKEGGEKKGGIREVNKRGKNGKAWREESRSGK